MLWVALYVDDAKQPPVASAEMKFCIKDPRLSDTFGWVSREEGSTWNGAEFQGNNRSSIALKKPGQTRPIEEPSQPSKAAESGWQRPGTTEAADVDRANTEINAVYQKLMGALDQNKQKRLREEERAWLKSRDTEAERIAREGGAVGGSALREDILVAQAKLTRERTEVLRSYLKNPETIP